MATKKVKKVEVPIDQRETFVSLQKNFAEGEDRVEEKLKLLYNLQKADSEIDKIIQLRGELPAEVEELEAELAALRTQSADISSFIIALNQSITDNKQNILDCDDQITKYQGQLQGVTNSREFDSINKEIENQSLLRQIAEKNIYETKAKVVEKKDELEDVKARINERSEDLKLKKQELETIVESTAKEETTLKARRDSIAKKLDERTMSAYERIRASVHNHLAVVGVYNENACGGCFSIITPQRLVDIASDKKLVICEHCGRIIVDPDFE